MIQLLRVNEKCSLQSLQRRLISHAHETGKMAVRTLSLIFLQVMSEKNITHLAKKNVSRV